MRDRKSLLTSLLLFVAGAAISWFGGHTAFAQSTAVPVLPAGGAAVVEASGGAAVMDASGDAAANPGGETSGDAASELETQRLTKFKQQTFDRRPSAILKLWFELQKEADEKDKPEKDADKPQEDEEKDKGKDVEQPKEKENSPSKPDSAKPAKGDKPAEDGKTAKDDKPAEDAKTSEDEKKSDDGKPAEGSEDEKEAAAKKKAEEEAARKKAEAEKIDKELKQFQRDVTLGHWDAVKTYLSEFSEKPGKEAYQHLLMSLAAPSQDGQQQMQMQMAIQSLPPMMRELAMQARQHDEKSVFNIDDVLGLTLAAPAEALDETTLPLLARIVQLSIAQGHAVEMLVARLHEQSVEADGAKSNDADSKTNGDKKDGEKKDGGNRDEGKTGDGKTDENKADSNKPDDDRTDAGKTDAGKTDGAKPKSTALTRRQAARLLIAAGQAIHIGAFLPTAEEAAKKEDREALHLLSHYFLALNAKENKREYLEGAWRAVQGALVGDGLSESDRQQTLQQAVTLAPQIRAELGQKWLSESFTSQSHRGAEILATIGAAVAQGIRQFPQQPDQRLASLKLQRDAVEALLDASADDLDDWREPLTLLAENWTREAELSYQLATSTSLGPQMQFDYYGNVYFVDPDGSPMMNHYNGQRVQAIGVGDVLEVQPNDTWRGLLDASLKPNLASLHARLYLKVNEEEKAFPYIEQLAVTHPDRASDLADEFLRVWARNHNPNSQNQRYGGMLWMYGFQPRAEGIPLTRSKQERNLQELETWVGRLRKLPIRKLDQDLLAEAFTQSYSTAEVYRLEAIEHVFGSLDDTDPKTLGALAQKMRSNLAGVWRAPAVQQQAKTKRKKQDLEAEVLRGYQVAHQVVDGGLEKHPDQWRLLLAKAALLHDENNYHRELNPDHDFAEHRREALAMFGKAAELYAKAVPALEADDYSTEPFDIWFYASLGACELNDVSEDNRLAQSQPPLIRKALLALPEKAAKEHLDRFANNLFQRLSGAKPQVKYRYLKAGLEIVGDHPQAREAQKLFDYYGDLVTEIKFEAAIDGSDKVGHGEPFGVFVNIRHTKEIERESGGFGKYLQNQNNMYWAYNYGRPLADYRDRFEKAARAALEEHFNVLSITFQDESVQSRADQPYGWRVTPYAYILLEPQGPKIDKLPPLSIDLDFIDTSGYVILPIESPAVPLDCSQPSGEKRPAENVKVVETLDERQAKEGKLILELKATGNGLVPPLDDLLDLDFAGFKVDKADKQPVAVSRFDPDRQQNVVVSERIWTLTMRAESGEKRPELFRFASAKPAAGDVELTYQRYDDADMVHVDREIKLEKSYGDSRRTWIWAGVIGAVLLGAIAIGVVALRPKRKTAEASAFEMPETLTPFTVLGLLSQIQQNDGLDRRGREELSAAIDRIESHYYAGADAGDIDLREVADTWVRRAKRRAKTEE